MENQILSTALKSRESYELIASYIKPKAYSREFQLLFGYVGDYYLRDRSATKVDRELLGQLLGTSIPNEKHVDRFLGIVDEALLADVSEMNVRQIVLQAKQQELGLELAMAISNGKEHANLVEEYKQLLKYTTLDELVSAGIEVYTHEDMARLLEEDSDPTGRLVVYPLALNERFDGGMRGSDHMVLFARPEMGKTGLVVTMAGGFAKQKSRGIIFNNEERIARLYMRQISNLIGWTIHEIRANRDKAMELAYEAGFEYIKFVSLSPGTLREIEDFVEKEEPDWFVVDQLRNIAIKSESRTNQLEAVAQGIRNIGKRTNTRAISITQAGDSAEGKAILEMGDIDFSNTGIQSACDVLGGVGATPEQMLAGIRVFTLCKNKLGGVHDSFPTRFNPFLSKYVSIKENS
jgi:replicative DNA helicase